MKDQLNVSSASKISMPIANLAMVISLVATVVLMYSSMTQRITSLETSRELMLNVTPASPTDYVPRFCAILNLPTTVESYARDILEKAEQIDLTAGRGPTGIAAASVYLAGIIKGYEKTQREVSDAAGVTEVTIRNRYKELIQNLNIELDI